MKHVLLAIIAACSATSPPVAPAPSVSSEIDCSPGDHDEAAIYCAHVHDPCCGSNGQGWVCNNARFVDWYADQCRR